MRPVPITAREIYAHTYDSTDIEWLEVVSSSLHAGRLDGWVAKRERGASGQCGSRLPGMNEGRASRLGLPSKSPSGNVDQLVGTWK
jgi:hypothetical protein